MRVTTLAIASRPLVPVAIAFAVGVGAGTLPAGAVVSAATALALLAAAAAFRTSVLWAACVVCAFIAAGALRESVTVRPTASDVSGLAGPGDVTVEGTVASDVDRRDNELRCLLNVDRVLLPNRRIARCTGIAEARLRAGQTTPWFGDRISATGLIELPREVSNPGNIDYAAMLRHRGVFAVLAASRPGAWSVLDPSSALGSPASVVMRAAMACRRSLVAQLVHLLQPDDAGLLAGIMIGDKSAIPLDLDEAFKSTGTAHILATAGLHVGIIAFVLLWLFRRLLRSRRAGACVTIALIALYAVIAGGRPAVFRAAIMMDLYLLAYVLDREPDAPSALAAAALVILAFRPGDLFDAGFQLSFATVAVIIALLGPVERGLEQLRSWQVVRNTPGKRLLFGARDYAVELTTLSVGAQIGSMPLVAQHFNLASPFGILANILIVPAVGLLLFAGFAAWLASFVLPPVAHAIANIVLHRGIAYVTWVVRGMAGFPGGSVFVSSPGWPVILLSYAAILWAAASAERWRARPQYVEADVKPLM